jgi:hypothetical protein
MKLPDYLCALKPYENETKAVFGRLGKTGTAGVWGGQRKKSRPVTLGSEL